MYGLPWVDSTSCESPDPVPLRAETICCTAQRLLVGAFMHHQTMYQSKLAAGEEGGCCRCSNPESRSKLGRLMSTLRAVCSMEAQLVYNWGDGGVHWELG